MTGAQDFSIHDSIQLPRHKEAVHSDPKVHAKIEALKHAYMLRAGSQDYSSLEVSLAIVGVYVHHRILALLSEP